MTRATSILAIWSLTLACGGLACDRADHPPEGTPGTVAERAAQPTWSAAEMRALSDRLELTELINRYALGIDSMDGELLAAVFTPDAVADYEIEPLGIREHLEGFDAIVGWLRSMLGERENAVPWHFMSTHIVEIDGDRARVRAYQHNRHMSGIGLYTADAIRTAEGWRIEKLHLEEQLLVPAASAPSELPGSDR
ncbi:MAG: nuclear transport factor 2 family protein [Deltaproteobacteria bacterium]|nr:nuclear transport factor 2 family protein [Deltaproteobacteria bacterium]MBW2418260.1 nuclear transport factor 2 family protein [Deltaproteobacteria bacterium]